MLGWPQPYLGSEISPSANRSLGLLGLVVLGVLALSSMLRADPGDQPTTRIALLREAYEARFYAPPAETALRGLIVFGSGDGGWSYWEERISRHLATRGFAVAGVDFQAYAAQPFSAEILREDYRRLVAELRLRHPDATTLPLLYGGWSMGAEHAFPAAADRAARPAGLCGLILVAPGARARYGLKLSDKLGITPTGEDTFALRDLAPACADLRLAAFHGGLDPLDDLEWPKGLDLDHRLWVIPRVLHDFSNAGEGLRNALDDALFWLLQPPRSPADATPAAAP
ncbi:MAG: hypothetical protein NTU80_02230 [Verrucomicrobia bacterium]|nr:hypothetical protein [Verrucomicrobiota bacterium]